jgi:tRNA(Ile)-lysidine synthase
LAEAEEALDWSARRLRGERLSGGPDRLALDPSGLPAELRRRLLLELFRAAGAPAPRGEAVQRLLATLEAGGAATLAGLKCSGGPVWRFEPEMKRERH